MSEARKRDQGDEKGEDKMSPLHDISGSRIFVWAKQLVSGKERQCARRLMNGGGGKGGTTELKVEEQLIRERSERIFVKYLSYKPRK